MDHAASQPAPADLPSPLCTISIPRIGADWPGEGGINGGLMGGQNGNPDYFLILPTDPDGNTSFGTEESFGPIGQRVDGADSEFDGLANTRALAASSIAHPAARWVTGLSIDGHTDFYIPSPREWRLLQANLSQHFAANSAWWTSAQFRGHDGYAWVQHFDSNGLQWCNDKNNERRVCPVRRVLIIQ